MKTENIAAALILLTALASCDTYYHVNSTISEDGSMNRQIYASADSADMAQSKWNKVYLFDTEGWIIEKNNPESKYSTLDGNEYTLNVKASRCYSKVDGKLVAVSENIPFLENILAPHEKVKRKFGWFYTYYTYQAVYKQIKQELPIPLDKYMTRKEQEIWFDDWTDSPRNMNGAEVYIMTSDLQNKFTKWINNCQFEISLDIIAQLDSTTYGGRYGRQIKEQSDLLFKSVSHRLSDKDDYSSEQVCIALDKYYSTDYFSKLYSENEITIAKNEETEYRIFDIAFYHQKHTMTMPGKIYNSNVAIINPSKAEWNIDAYRLQNKDKIIILKSKTINYWAFIVTFIILIIPVFILKIRRNI